MFKLTLSKGAHFQKNESSNISGVFSVGVETSKFSRREMREHAKQSYKFIGDRIFAAQRHIARIKSTLRNEPDGAHRDALIEKLSCNVSIHDYWVCVAAQKGLPSVSQELFAPGNIAFVEGRRTRIKEVHEHLVWVEVLDNEDLGMIYHYPHAAFEDVYEQKNGLYIVS